MIFTLTAIALVLTASIMWRARRIRAGARPGLADRIADAALLPAVAVTVVGLVYSALSLPFVTANLDQMTLEQLRVLEKRVPDWACELAGWMPEWYMMALLAIFALWLAVLRTGAKADPQVRRIAFWQRLVARVRNASNVAGTVACGLFAASALTLFGDGLADKVGDVRAEIHQAELRFEAGTDRLVATLATEIVEQSINAMRSNLHHPNALLARDIGQSFQTIRSAVDEYWRAPRSDPAAQRALLLGLEISADASAIDANAVVDATLGSDAIMDTTLSAAQREHGALRFRERVKRAAMTMLAGDKTFTKELSTERRELSKALLEGVVAQFKDAAGKDPIVVFFAEVFGSMVTEALAVISSQTLLEPTLERLWNAADAPAWRDAAKLEVKKIIDGIDTSRHWAGAGGGVVTSHATWFASVKGVADWLRSVQLIPPGSSNAPDRAGVLPFSEKFSSAIGTRLAPSHLSDILKFPSPPPQPPLSRDELERLVELLESLGQSDSATRLRQKIHPVAADGLGPVDADTVVVDSLKSACIYLASHGVLANWQPGRAEAQVGIEDKLFVKNPTFKWQRPFSRRPPLLPRGIRVR